MRELAHLITKLRSTQIQGAKGHLLRIAILSAATSLNVLAILWVGAPQITWLVAGFSIIATAVILLTTKRWNRIPATIRGAWKNPYVFSILAALVAIPLLIGVPVAFHQKYVTANTTLPEEGHPWRQGLPARVWWQEPPTQELETGLAEAAKELGIAYERIESVDLANLRVWLNSWTYKCKWLSAHAFVSLDPSPSACGAQTGDIYLCRYTTPFADREISDRAVIAHEAAHIFAAQPHFGDGLMAEGGGTYAHWFTDEELQAMRAQISEYRISTQSECADLP